MGPVTTAVIGEITRRKVLTHHSEIVFGPTRAL